MAPLKDKKKKKARKPKGPRKPAGKPFGAVYKTGLNRDIPMGGAGGSQNLIANLLASKQAQPAAQPPQVIQTPDQFKLAQDIKAIRAEQAVFADEQKRLQKYPIYLPGDKLGKEMPMDKLMEQEIEEDLQKIKSAGVSKRGPRGPYKKGGLTAEQAEEAAKEMLKTTPNLSKLSGEEQADIAAGAARAAMQAHEEAGAKLPAEAKKAPGKVQPDALGGHKKGKRGAGGKAIGELAEKGEDAEPELKE
jgi:hypothetical protein